MTLDALACEPQFVDHLAPVWRALPPEVRGRFLVDDALVERAFRRGVAAEPLDSRTIRGSMPLQPPRFDGDLALVASIGDIKVGRRIGYGPFAFIEHGIGQSYAGARGAQRDHASYAGGTDRDDVELFMVPGPHPAERWRVAYPRARVEVVGSPRLDDLPRRTPGPGPVVAISFHWPNHMSPEHMNALGDYMPSLASLAARFDLIGHAHPKGDWPVRMERIYRRLGIRYVADFAEVCRQADVYVCDNSSTIFEFAATGRPVVLLNSKHYRRTVEHGLRFWQAAHVGINVDTPDQLIPGIERALEDGVDLQWDREDALQLVYQPRTNGAAYAATAILDWLASRQAVAA